jgi:membrane-bound metal-dependent hydrolase YbcI (DUF457 family)
MWLGVYAVLATFSHAIADMMTTYPIGVALISPFSDARYQSRGTPSRA